MRKIQDYYFHKAKKENYPARSVYKLEEAQRRHRFLKPGRRVLDLGCHPGSWSLYAAEAVGPKGLVVGIDLQAGETRQKSGAEIIRLCYDVRLSGLADILLARWPGFHTLLSDMAPATTGSRFADHQKSLILCRRALELAERLLHPGGSLYVKAFQGGDFPEFLAECESLFDEARVVKPQSSRRESRELFVLGLGYRRPKPEATIQPSSEP